MGCEVLFYIFGPYCPGEVLLLLNQIKRFVLFNIFWPTLKNRLNAPFLLAFSPFFFFVYLVLFILLPLDIGIQQ